MKKIVVVACLALGGCPAGEQKSPASSPLAPPAAKATPAPAAPARAASDPAASPAPAKTPGLVGHWKLDEKSGDRAEDSSGNGNAGALAKGPAWGEGKSGGALVFDGTEKYVDLPNSPALENVQEGNYSVAAWFKPANLPPGTESANNANYGILVKGGWHTGLHYTSEGKFVFEHWIKGEKVEEPVWCGAGTWDTAHDPGKWYHLAATVDKAAGAIKLYVNGEEAGSGEFEAGKAAREYGEMPWRIGIGIPGAPNWSWPAKGAIDDVRIYSKSLTADEVRALAK